MSEQALNIMDAMYKNASMGEKTISAILSHVKDSCLRNELQNQKSYYKKLGTELENVYSKMNAEAKDVGAVSKALADADIRLKTLVDSSTEHVAEMMIDGTNNGILELEKAVRNNPDIPWQLKKDSNDTIKHEQEYIERLKEFL